MYDFLAEVVICSFDFLSVSQKDELDDIPIELSKVQSVKVGSFTWSDGCGLYFCFSVAILKLLITI